MGPVTRVAGPFSLADCQAKQNFGQLYVNGNFWNARAFARSSTFRKMVPAARFERAA